MLWGRKYCGMRPYQWCAVVGIAKGAGTQWQGIWAAILIPSTEKCHWATPGTKHSELYIQVDLDWNFCVWWSQILHILCGPGICFFPGVDTGWSSQVHWLEEFSPHRTQQWPHRGPMTMKAHSYVMLEGLRELQGLQNFPEPSPHWLLLPTLWDWRARMPWNHTALLFPLTLTDWLSAPETRVTGRPTHAEECRKHSRGRAPDLCFPLDLMLCPVLSPCDPWPPFSHFNSFP